MNFMVRSPVLQAWCQNAPFVLPPLGRDRIPFKLSINLRPPSMPSQPPPELRVRPPRRGASVAPPAAPGHLAGAGRPAARGAQPAGRAHRERHRAVPGTGKSGVWGREYGEDLGSDQDFYRFVLFSLLLSWLALSHQGASFRHVSFFILWHLALARLPLPKILGMDVILSKTSPGLRMVRAGEHSDVSPSWRLGDSPVLTWFSKRHNAFESERFGLGRVPGSVPG